MKQKKPKDPSFYDRFKFDKELFDTIFSKNYHTEKALLYLTALAKAVLPQDKPSEKKDDIKNKPEALNRIIQNYKKEVPSKPNKNTTPPKTKENFQANQIVDAEINENSIVSNAFFDFG